MALPDSFFSIISVYLRKIEYKLRGIISIRPTLNKKGHVLLSYVKHPFVITKKEFNQSSHTNLYECLIITEIFLERGFAVDIIDWTNKKFVPKKKYDIVIDIHSNLERLAPFLSQKCVKIFYATGAYWLYQNNAEQKRLDNLQKRRGCNLQPRRKLAPSKAIENADYAIALGNGFARETFNFSGKKIIDIPLFSIPTLPSPEHKDFDNIRKNFVWIGGGGAVHKGLDLVLECFAKMPDYKLTVCGPIGVEKDFVDCYKKELYKTPNIKYVGRIDVKGEFFKKITEESIGLIYPSCSEGQAGSVITALHAGLIPITTHQSGVNAEPFGVELKTPSVEEIINAIKYVSSLPETDLKLRSIAVWNYAQRYHTREQFKKSYASFIDVIIKERNI